MNPFLALFLLGLALMFLGPFTCYTTTTTTRYRTA
jgi:hypothetical protein